MYSFKFADIGEGLHEGVVQELSAKVGDVVKDGDTLFVVETDKVTSDITSPVSGTILKVLIEEGQTVHVGEEMFVIDDGTGDELPTESAPVEEEEENASVVGSVPVSSEILNFGSFGTKHENTSHENTPEPKPTPVVDDAKYDYDVIIIGAGPGGYYAGEIAPKHGLKTLIIERKYWGGTCLNVGCIPTKSLLKTAHTMHDIIHSSDYGVETKIENIELNWEKALERKNNIVSALTAGVKGLLERAKATTVEGDAEIVSEHEVIVDGKSYTTRDIVIATGSEPVIFDLPGFKEAHENEFLITSDTAINLKELPKTMVIIGGGVIGCEFAIVFADLGVKVTIIQNLDTILEMLDRDISNLMTTELIEKGIEIRTLTNAKGIVDGQLIIESDGKEETIKADKVLLSVGRKPVLPKTSLKFQMNDFGRYVIDENHKTSYPNIYAIGDCVTKIMLAHVAYKEAKIAISSISGFGKDDQKRHVPSCIYSYPEISSVGLTEQQAKEQGLDYFVGKRQMKVLGKSLADGSNKNGLAKVIADKTTGEIIGIHFICNGATDMIAEACILMDLEATIFDIYHSIHPHPSYSEGLVDACQEIFFKMMKNEI